MDNPSSIAFQSADCPTSTADQNKSNAEVCKKQERSDDGDCGEISGNDLSIVWKEASENDLPNGTGLVTGCKKQQIILPNSNLSILVMNDSDCFTKCRSTSDGADIKEKSVGTMDEAITDHNDDHARLYEVDVTDEDRRNYESTTDIIVAGLLGDDSDALREQSLIADSQVLNHSEQQSLIDERNGDLEDDKDVCCAKVPEYISPQKDDLLLSDDAPPKVVSTVERNDEIQRQPLTDACSRCKDVRDHDNQDKHLLGDDCKSKDDNREDKFVNTEMIFDEGEVQRLSSVALDGKLNPTTDQLITDSVDPISYDVVNGQVTDLPHNSTIPAVARNQTESETDSVSQQTVDASEVLGKHDDREIDHGHSQQQLNDIEVEQEPREKIIYSDVDMQTDDEQSDRNSDLQVTALIETSLECNPTDHCSTNHADSYAVNEASTVCNGDDETQDEEHLVTSDDKDQSDTPENYLPTSKIDDVLNNRNGIESDVCHAVDIVTDEKQSQEFLGRHVSPDEISQKFPKSEENGDPVGSFEQKNVADKSHAELNEHLSEIQDSKGDAEHLMRAENALSVVSEDSSESYAGASSKSESERQVNEMASEAANVKNKLIDDNFHAEENDTVPFVVKDNDLIADNPTESTVTNTPSPNDKDFIDEHQLTVQIPLEKSSANQIDELGRTNVSCIDDEPSGDNATLNVETNVVPHSRTEVSSHNMLTETQAKLCHSREQEHGRETSNEPNQLEQLNEKQPSAHSILNRNQDNGVSDRESSLPESSVFPSEGMLPINADDRLNDSNEFQQENFSTAKEELVRSVSSSILSSDHENERRSEANNDLREQPDSYLFTSSAVLSSSDDGNCVSGHVSKVIDDVGDARVEVQAAVSDCEGYSTTCKAVQQKLPEASSILHGIINGTETEVNCQLSIDNDVRQLDENSDEQIAVEHETADESQSKKSNEPSIMNSDQQERSNAVEDKTLPASSTVDTHDLADDVLDFVGRDSKETSCDKCSTDSPATTETAHQEQRRVDQKPENVDDADKQTAAGSLKENSEDEMSSRKPEEFYAANGLNKELLIAEQAQKNLESHILAVEERVGADDLSKNCEGNSVNDTEVEHPSETVEETVCCDHGENKHVSDNSGTNHHDAELQITSTSPASEMVKAADTNRSDSDETTTGIMNLADDSKVDENDEKKNDEDGIFRPTVTAEESYPTAAAKAQGDEVLRNHVNNGIPGDDLTQLKLADTHMDACLSIKSDSDICLSPKLCDDTDGLDAEKKFHEKAEDTNNTVCNVEKLSGDAKLQPASDFQPHSEERSFHDSLNEGKEEKVINYSASNSDHLVESEVRPNQVTDPVASLDHHVTQLNSPVDQQTKFNDKMPTGTEEHSEEIPATLPLPCKSSKDARNVLINRVIPSGNTWKSESSLANIDVRQQRRFKREVTDPVIAQRFDEMKKRILTAKPIAPSWTVDNQWNEAKAILAKRDQAERRKSCWSLSVIEDNLTHQCSSAVGEFNHTDAPATDSKLENAVPMAAAETERKPDQGKSTSELFVKQTVDQLDLPQWYHNVDHSSDQLQLKHTRSVHDIQESIDAVTEKKDTKTRVLADNSLDIIKSLRPRLDQSYSLDVYFNHRTTVYRSRAISTSSERSTDSLITNQSFELPSRKLPHRLKTTALIPIKTDSFEDIMKMSVAVTAMQQQRKLSDSFCETVDEDQSVSQSELERRADSSEQPCDSSIDETDNGAFSTDINRLTNCDDNVNTPSASTAEISGPDNAVESVSCNISSEPKAAEALASLAEPEDLEEIDESDDDNQTNDENDEVDGDHSMYANFDVIPMEQFHLVDPMKTSTRDLLKDASESKFSADENHPNIHVDDDAGTSAVAEVDSGLQFTDEMISTPAIDETEETSALSSGMPIDNSDEKNDGLLASLHSDDETGRRNVSEDKDKTMQQQQDEPSRPEAPSKDSQLAQPAAAATEIIAEDIQSLEPIETSQRNSAPNPSTEMSGRKTRRRRPQPQEDATSSNTNNENIPTKRDSQRRSGVDIQPANPNIQPTSDGGEVSILPEANGGENLIEPTYAVIPADRKPRSKRGEPKKVENEQAIPNNQPAIAPKADYHHRRARTETNEAEVSNMLADSRPPERPRDSSSHRKSRSGDNRSSVAPKPNESLIDRTADKSDGYKHHRRTPSLPSVLAMNPSGVTAPSAMVLPVNQRTEDKAAPPSVPTTNASSRDDAGERGRSASLSWRDRLSFKLRKKNHQLDGDGSNGRDSRPDAPATDGNATAEGNVDEDGRPKRSQSSASRSDKRSSVPGLKFLKKLPPHRKGNSNERQQQQQPSPETQLSQNKNPPTPTERQRSDPGNLYEELQPQPSTADNVVSPEGQGVKPRGRSTAASIRHTLSAPVRRIIRAVSGDRRSGRTKDRDNDDGGNRPDQRSPDSTSAPDASSAPPSAAVTSPIQQGSLDAPASGRSSLDKSKKLNYDENSNFRRDDTARKPRRKRPPSESHDDPSNVRPLASSTGIEAKTTV